MAATTEELKIRGQLPIVRFFQGYLPFRLANRLMEIGNRRVQIPSSVTRTPVVVDGVPCERLIPGGSPDDRALLYLHGGGFVYQLSPLHISMVAYLAQTMGMRALMVDYRVAPEHPFPAALDDCVTAYRWLLKQGIPAENIVAAGDSAGGNLTITMMMKLRLEGEPLPAAAACLSPVGDLSGSSKKDVPDPLLSPRAIRRYNTAYVGRHDPCDPLVSPVFGDFRGLPPLLVHAGEDEILREDAVRIERRARDAGVEAQVKIFPRMWHVWQLFLDLPQARESLEEIAQFLSAKITVNGNAGEGTGTLRSPGQDR